ncbi:hypothetical protein Tco_0716197 [Tanacetum coccineum]
MLLNSINNGPFQLKKIIIPKTETTTAITRMQELSDRTPEEKTRRSCDIKAKNIILLGFPSDIYTLVNHHKITRDIWNKGYGVNTGKGEAIGTRVINTVRDLKANLPRKRVKDAEWFKEKMLLAQAQESEVIFQEEQQDFLADGMEELDSNCDDLHLNTTLIFKADQVDAFDSDCDEAPRSSPIFMARLCPTGSINGDDVGPTYDSDILS